MTDDSSLRTEADPPCYLPLTSATRPLTSPSIQCPNVDYRSWATWRNVGVTMTQVPVLPFGQSWLTEDEADFAPGAVAIGHHDGNLVLYAELIDDDIFNPIQEHGAHAYKAGDVFEIFLRAEGEENYLEHHITPDNYTFQLSFPTLTAFAENCSSNPDWAKPFATAVRVSSNVFLQPEISVWRLLVVVPLRSLTSNKENPLPTQWRFSICRYDYTEGREKPVLSSTTPYRYANFHHHEAWGTLTLV